jgi:mono/diheme cytochrome c family protein
MSVRKIASGCVIALLVLAAGLWWVWRPAIAALPEHFAVLADRKSIAHGADLATVGNCADCHTVSGRPLFSGGRPLPTPFGTIYGSNLTPDRTTGIGAWSEEAFKRAMREGVDREGRQLYPAFPYDHFRFATDDDVRSIYDFLMSRPAVENQVPDNQLPFPFNIRLIVAGWKLLFLHQDPLQPDPTQSKEWNRGRYLVEGLGHCGSCHTPRNMLGAEKRGQRYAGGIADNWRAPPLNESLVKRHRWTVDHLTEYLSTGWHREHGVAAGPMADVAKNLGEVSQEEVHAIATYVVSLSHGAEQPTLPSADRPNTDTGSIVAVYDGACARCHNSGRDVGPSNALSLTLSAAVQGPNSANAVRAIMYGIEDYLARGGPYMPAFNRILTDEQIAALTRYVRTRYSDQPEWTGVEAEVAKARHEGSSP